MFLSIFPKSIRISTNYCNKINKICNSISYCSKFLQPNSKNCGIFLQSVHKNQNRSISYCTKFQQKRSQDDDFLENGLEEDNSEYEYMASRCFVYKEQNCLIIHPHIKWGPKKKLDTKPETELSEAVALIHTLPGWKVSNQLIVPLETVDKKQIFGRGTLEKLKQLVYTNRNISAVFINVGVLKNLQISELETIFRVPILDRYKIVMQILREHATSKHSKLQVALAEIPYLRSRLKYLETDSEDNWRVRDKMLEERERKLKNALKKLRSQRELLRNKRRDLNYPVVAVVGYTNVGKTSLIKCLTGDKSLQPKNQMFATLDVTMHAGILPSKLEVLFVDTVGFITDIPTNLIECFIATLEDAMLADVVIHVQDISNESMMHQRKHVDSVLNSLAEKVGNEKLLERIIHVGNKSDLVTENKDCSPEDLILVSAKSKSGVDKLRQKIENLVLQTTGRRTLTIRVPTGGDEMRWLFKNATVVGQTEDEEDTQFNLMKIIISEAKLNQFHGYFVANK